MSVLGEPIPGFVSLGDFAGQFVDAHSAIKSRTSPLSCALLQLIAKLSKSELEAVSMSVPAYSDITKAANDVRELSCLGALKNVFGLTDRSFLTRTSTMSRPVGAFNPVQ